MAERRYSEAEMASIFENAADAEAAGRRPAGGAEGMTLAQLQEIGREVGISPEAVAQAARLVEHRGQPVSRRWLGMPIGVGRTLELGRRLSDREWEDLVVDLRETFDARGHVSAQGSFRQWTNGNLQALLEPTSTGQRLRIRTFKGSAQSLILAGMGMAGAAVVMALVTVIPRGGSLGEALLGIAPLMTMAAGLLGVGALRLPSWARLRGRQMEEVLARLAQAVGEPAPDRALPSRPPAED
jgi:hypothetical protein